MDKDTEKVHQASLDGCSQELGEVDRFRWYGLILGGVKGVKVRDFILHEDNQGFKDFEAFDSKGAAKKAWAKLEQEEAAFEAGAE